MGLIFLGLISGTYTFGNYFRFIILVVIRGLTLFGPYILFLGKFLKKMILHKNVPVLSSGPLETDLFIRG